MSRLHEIWHTAQQSRPDSNELVKCCLPDGSMVKTTRYKIDCVLSSSDLQLLVKDGIHYLCPEDEHIQLGKALAKSANQRTHPLDQPATFGDALLAQYRLRARRHEV